MAYKTLRTLPALHTFLAGLECSDVVPFSLRPIKGLYCKVVLSSAM